MSSATVSPGLEEADQDRRTRPNALALPSPTAGRALLLVAVFLTAGLFVGNAVHTRYFYRSYLTAFATCLDKPLLGGATDPRAVFAHAADIAACRRPSELRRAGISVAGPVLAGLLALLILLVHPVLLERRRRLRPLTVVLPAASGRATSERYERLAREMGMARAPVLVLGPSLGKAAVTDAFSYGLGRGRRVALPTAVALRPHDHGVFDHLVRHELAHHVRRDVGLSWLARSMWFGLLPLLVLPVLLDPSHDRAYLADYAWRVALLAVAALLVSRALLRSREHEADLTAAQRGHDVAGMQHLLERLRPVTRTRRQALLARHPTRAERLRVVAEPELAVQVTFVDGFVAALLCGLCIPLLTQVAQSALTGQEDSSSHAMLFAVLATCPLLATVGLGLARAALVCRTARARLQVAPAAIGVGVGLVAGELASLAQTANGTIGGSDHPLSLLLSGWGAAGATVVAGGLAQLTAAAAGRLRPLSTVRVATALANSMLFAVVLWVSISAQVVIGAVPTLEVTRSWLVLVEPTWQVAASVSALAAYVLTLTALSVGSLAAPAWSVEGAGSTGPDPGTAAPLRPAVVGAVVPSGVLAGGLATAAIAVVHAGDPATPIPRHLGLFLALMAAAAAAAWSGVRVGLPDTGPAVGLVASTLASSVGALGLLWVLHRHSAALLRLELRTSTGVGFACALALTPLFLVQRRSLTWPSWWVVPLATTVTTCLALGAVLLLQ